MTTRPRSEVIAALNMRDPDAIDHAHGCLQCVEARSATRRANEAWTYASSCEAESESSCKRAAADRRVAAEMLDECRVTQSVREHSPLLAVLSCGMFVASCVMTAAGCAAWSAAWGAWAVVWRFAL